MKTKLIKSLALVLAMICLLCFPVPVSATGVAQGTDGTELQVMQPEKLEIQLGESWAGVEFELKTDAGKYPGTIIVGEDGVLRLEIGGSSSYVLSCMNSAVDVPAPGETLPPAAETSPADGSGDAAPSATEESALPTEETAPNEVTDENSIAGIPIAHLALFGGGLIIAVGALAVLQFSQKRRESRTVYDDDDENDEF